MAKKQVTLEALRPFCEETARQMGLEFCDVIMEKEPQGRYLRFYVDKEGGLSLDDCERFHRTVQRTRYGTSQGPHPERCRNDYKHTYFQSRCCFP